LVQVSIAGSTGSVGTQALDVISGCRNQFDLVAIFANSSVELLAEQANSFRPKIVGLGCKDHAKGLFERLDYSPQVVAGEEALIARQDFELGAQRPDHERDDKPEHPERIREVAKHVFGRLVWIPSRGSEPIDRNVRDLQGNSPPGAGFG